MTNRRCSAAPGTISHSPERVFELATLTLVGVLLLSGCSGLLHRDAAPDQTYILRAPPTPSAPAPPLAGAPSLRIGRTLVAPGLDSDRVVLVRSDHRMDYFAGSRWVAPVAQMVEDLAAATLRNSGAWGSVHDSQGAFPTEYFLQLDIRRFEADYSAGEPPKVHVIIDCTLGKRADREPVRHFVAEGTAVADANRMSSVVDAFDSASQVALSTIAERSAQVLASPPAAPQSP
jgi:cholesterol transport system auxiliary component